MYPKPYETNRVKTMGMNKSTLAVVSSMMTANANVILVAPDSIAVAPRIAKNDALILPVPSSLIGSLL